MVLFPSQHVTRDEIRRFVRGQQTIIYKMCHFLN